MLRIYIQNLCTRICKADSSGEHLCDLYVSASAGVKYVISEEVQTLAIMQRREVGRTSWKGTGVQRAFPLFPPPSVRRHAHQMASNMLYSRAIHGFRVRQRGE